MADEIWGDDRLDRKVDSKHLATFLRNRSREIVERGEQRAYVLNVDARWGDGKTFFMKRFQKQLQEDGHIAVYVDAWKDDFADDPLIAVMAAIDKEVAGYVQKETASAERWAEVKSSTGKVARLVVKGLALRGLSLALTTGVATAIDETLSRLDTTDPAGRATAAGGSVVDETIEAVEKVLDEKTEEAISDFDAMKSSIENFRQKLASFVVTIEKEKGIPAPFFILIDELDRCRPPYAIAMLERVKHLFEVPNVVFVVATDSGQLVHSIKAVYGSGFEGERYLKRFFDRTYVFEEQSLEQLIAQLWEDNPLDSRKLSSPFENKHEQFIRSFFEARRLDLRSTAQAYDMLRTIATIWEEKVPIELVLMLPLIAAFHADPQNIKNSAATIAHLQNAIPGWQLDWFALHPVRERIKRSTNCMELAAEMFAAASKPLPDTSSASGDGRDAKWMRDRFSHELNVLHDGRWFDGAEPSSIIRDYPAIVRRAGRLLKNTGEPEAAS